MFRLYDPEIDHRVQRGKQCFLPGMELFNQNSTNPNAKIVRNKDGTIDMIMTEKIEADEQIFFEKDSATNSRTEHQRLVINGYTERLGQK